VTDPVYAVPPGLMTGNPVAPSGRSVKAARAFEAQLIGSLLESLERTFASVPGQDSIPGADDYNYLGIQALSTALAEHGGLGIASLITHALAAHEGKE